MIVSEKCICEKIISGEYGVYANVAKVLPWILENSDEYTKRCYLNV